MNNLTNMFFRSYLHMGLTVHVYVDTTQSFSIDLVDVSFYLTDLFYLYVLGDCSLF